MRWIPEGSTEIRADDVDAVVYCQERGVERKTFVAMGYHGKRNAHDFYHAFPSIEARDKHIAEYLDGLRYARQVKAERWAERRNFQHGFKVGDILHYSWGYEQTQCEYFQVVEVRGRQIVIRRCASQTVEGSGYSHGMADMRLPVKDRFVDEPLVKTPQPLDGRPKGYVRMEYGIATEWDGQPKYCSWYG